MADYTATALVASIRRQGFLPESSSLTSADLLAWVNDESRIYIASILKSVHEEFMVNEVDYSISFVSGTGGYRLPNRVVGGGLRTLGVLSGVDVYPLTRVEPPNNYQYGTSGSPVAYMMRGNLIQLLPTPNIGGTLRLTYLQRMGDVVDASACATVSVINGLSVTLAGTLPATFLTTASYDFVRAQPAFETIGLDATASIAGSVFTFSAVPASLAVGDYVCLAGECPTPQIPIELQQLLQQRVIVRLLSSTGDPRLDAQKAILDEMKSAAVGIIAPRTSGNSRPIINRSAPGMRRGYRAGGGWR